MRAHLLRGLTLQQTSVQYIQPMYLLLFGGAMLVQMAAIRPLLIIGVFSVLASCGKSETDPPQTGALGSTEPGGASASGGATSTGGATNSGGLRQSGGASEQETNWKDVQAAFGNLKTVAGRGAFPDGDFWEPEYEGGLATDAELSRPHMALADAQDNIYIADKLAIVENDRGYVRVVLSREK